MMASIDASDGSSRASSSSFKAVSTSRSVLNFVGPKMAKRAKSGPRGIVALLDETRIGQDA